MSSSERRSAPLLTSPRLVAVAVVFGCAMLALGMLPAGAVPTHSAAPPPTSTTDPVAADWHTLATPPLAEGRFELVTLSTMPDTVTGGDVLVAVRGLDPADALTVRVGDRDISDAFATVDGERHGLVTGLPEGPSVITATSRDRVAALEVRNHPVTGPVISGPHQDPFECRTVDAGLGEPIDADCSIEPTATWYYRSANDQGFHELADPYAPYPDDAATTRTEDDRTVPFVVRVESRTVNRGIARIAVLDDPAGRGPDTPFDAAQWNRRVYHAFGESCGVGYQQGTNAPEMVLGALDLAEFSADNLLINLVGISDRLGAGDAIVHSTLTSFGVHCNPLVSIETTMMIKEYLTERYGLIEAIVGTNGSGAALQQYNAANNAPGLISAAMPTATFADIPTTAMTVTDCGLLNRYFEATSMDWSLDQRAAVQGHHPLTATDLNNICTSWEDTFLDRVDPTGGCSVPEEVRYHPETNPTGTRCTIQDANVNVFGTDPATGFAHRPVDNVGVQYGLEALRQGTISLAQFLELNESIGGYDIDGRPQPERHEMSPELAELTYRVGGVIGRGALDETPVLDLAPYLDLIPVANIHEAVRPFVVRDRLRTLSGTDQTQVIWRGVLTQADAYDDMAAWLAGVDAARPGHGGDHTAAVIAGRPNGFGDRCAIGTIGANVDLSSVTAPLGLAEVPLPLPLPDGFDADLIDVQGRVDLPEDFDSGIGLCSLALPVGATPRIAAGMPLSDDVIKCQLRPIDPADYPGASDAALDRLAAIFPDGVCDEDAPSVGDVESSMLWTSVGGETLEAPHELEWTVARSIVLPAAGPDATPADLAAPGDPAPTLPATGGGTDRVPIALLGAGVALAVTVAARRGPQNE